MFCSEGSLLPTGVMLLLPCSVVPSNLLDEQVQAEVLPAYHRPDFLVLAEQGMFPAFSGSISAHKTSIFQGCFPNFRPLSGRPEAVDLLHLFKTCLPCAAHFEAFWGQQQPVLLLLLMGFLLLHR
ncbi:hypothetical protein Salat_2799400 [Sesamum alatum]|uniref:Uncharacterized protein n=1 Tax=Sesamum alatum TaxID=300844 RepID=A0AAE1XM44_9LAMI|nr:hypothetical protein Salat_2799400 [Sesamum alatum]